MNTYQNILDNRWLVHPFLTQKNLTELTACPIRCMNSFQFGSVWYRDSWKKHVLQEKLQKLCTRLFIRRKYIEHTCHVLQIFFHIGKKLKLRVSEFLFNDSPKRLKFENTSVSMNDWKIDILRMLNFFVNLHTLTPFWSGWNCTWVEPRQYTQNI